MNWIKNTFNEPIYGGWNIKGVYTLFNSTTTDNYARLNSIVRITESVRGYGIEAVFSLDEGKYLAYIPMFAGSKKYANDIIRLEECCVVIMNKYGEDDIYRIIEKESVINFEDSQSRIDIFDHAIIVDTTEKWKEISRRLINETELSRLNTYIPGIVVDNGRGGYSCKLFAKGSTTQFYYKQIAPESDVHVGDMFDIMKCEVRCYKRNSGSEIKVKVFVPTEAKDLSRIESLKKQEEEAEKRRKQTQIKQSISHLHKYADVDYVKIETINKEYQHLCSLIGVDKAAEFKPYVDKAIERVNERIEKEKKVEEEKQILRENKFMRIELYTALGYWCIIWLIALILYLTGDKESSAELLAFFACFGPTILILAYFIFIYIPFKYDIKNNWAGKLLILLWFVDIFITIKIM